MITNGRVANTLRKHESRCADFHSNLYQQEENNV